MPFIVGPFIKKINPVACILLETEIWPNLINNLNKKAIIAGNYYTFFPYQQLCTNNANRYNLKTKDRPLKALDEQIHLHITALL